MNVKEYEKGLRRYEELSRNRKPDCRVVYVESESELHEVKKLRKELEVFENAYPKQATKIIRKVKKF